jgi:hypothetical protein
MIFSSMRLILSFPHLFIAAPCIPARMLTHLSKIKSHDVTKLAPVQYAHQVFTPNSHPLPVSLFLHAVQNLLNREMQRHHQVPFSPR